MEPFDAVLDFPCCHLGAVFAGETLTRLEFLPLDHALTPGCDSRARHLADELERYCRNPAHEFDLLFEPQGTPFQMRVWRALRGIPCGETLSYGALARQLGTAARALGQACGANPLPIVIPCHRVVAAHGLGGFNHAASGTPIAVKSWLLAHELCHERCAD